MNLSNIRKIVDARPSRGPLRFYSYEDLPRDVKMLFYDSPEHLEQDAQDNYDFLLSELTTSKIIPKGGVIRVDNKNNYFAKIFDVVAIWGYQSSVEEAEPPLRAFLERTEGYTFTQLRDTGAAKFDKLKNAILYQPQYQIKSIYKVFAFERD